jgi:serine/threonine-protein kinase
MSALRQGDRISNYLLEEPLGAGSFGEVWRARHHVFGDLVAIKVPTDPQYVRNLQREGVVIHGLKHPNIVRAVDMDPYADPPYLVMEYVEGPSLREVINHAGAQLSIATVLTVMRGILRALACAHDNGVLHRDVKPANVLLHHPLERVESITEDVVKVTDFGLGKITGLTAQSMMQSGSILTQEGQSISGTLAYMSPEQREGDEIDQRSDLYSCGIVFFEMLTGERPQGSEVPGMLRTQLPPGVDDVFRRCYTRRERRYASAEEMLRDIDALLRTYAGGRRVAQPVPPPPPPAVRGPGVAGVVCPQCGTTADQQDQFCIRCGRQLVERVPRCPSCTAYVQRDDRFCIFCGHDLRVLAS